MEFVRHLVMGVCTLAACTSSPTPSATKGTSPPDCGDTSSDRYHCGACDRTCWNSGLKLDDPGQECIAGVCQPEPIGGVALVKNNIAVSGGRAVRLDSYRHMLLEFFPQLGGDLTIEGTLVYGAAADGIRECDVEGCPGGPALVVPAALGEDLSLTSFAVTGDTVVFTAPYNHTPPSIRKCTVGACTSPETIYTGSVVGTITNVEAEGSILVFIDNDELRLCDLGNCQATVRTIGSKLVSFYPYIANLVVVGEGLIAWREYTIDNHYEASRVRACAPADCGAPTEIVATAGALYGVAISEGFIYVGMDSTPGFVRCPAAGCGGVPEPIPWIAGTSAPVPVQIYVSKEFYVIGSSKVRR